MERGVEEFYRFLIGHNSVNCTIIIYFDTSENLRGPETIIAMIMRNVEDKKKVLHTGISS